MWLTSSALEQRIHIQLKRFANIHHSWYFQAHLPLSRANWSTAASRDITGESTKSIPPKILPALKEESVLFARFVPNVTSLVQRNRGVLNETPQKVITTSHPHETMFSILHTGLGYMKPIPSSMQVLCTLEMFENMMPYSTRIGSFQEMQERVSVSYASAPFPFDSLE